MADKMTDVEQQEQIEDLSEPEVVNRYKEAARAVNAAIQKVLDNIATGKKVYDLCALGDQTVTELCAGIYKKDKKMQKGLAFPTCISVNNFVCHYSPDQNDNLVLKDGDVVRVDLGVHVDGFIAVAAHTVVLAAEVPAPLANLFTAANVAVNATLRLMKPGHTNTEVTNALNKVASEFNCNVAEGVLSHQMKRFVIDGTQVIISKATAEQRVEEFTFEENEVYAIDIVLTNGEGKLREGESKPFIYKRAPDTSYNLKQASAKQVFKDITEKFASLPFTIRALDAKTGKMGLLECWRHSLVDPYPVLCVKGDLVVHMKYTVLILPSGPQKVTGLELQKYTPSGEVKDEGLKAILNSGLSTKNKKKKDAAAATSSNNNNQTSAMDTN